MSTDFCFDLCLPLDFSLAEDSSSKNPASNSSSGWNSSMFEEGA
jgi:hypothetical protein